MALTLLEVGLEGSWSTINSNFALIEEEINQRVLRREITGGEANELRTHLDMNNERAINCADAEGDYDVPTYHQLKEYGTEAADAEEAAKNYAEAAGVSASTAEAQVALCAAQVALAVAQVDLAQEEVALCKIEVTNCTAQTTIATSKAQEAAVSETVTAAHVVLCQQAVLDAEAVADAVNLTNDQTVGGAKTWEDDAQFNSDLVVRKYLEVKSYDGTDDKMQSYYRDGQWRLQAKDIVGSSTDLTVEVVGWAACTQEPEEDDHLTRKDYVDLLDVENVKLTGAQEITGEKDFARARQLPISIPYDNLGEPSFTEMALHETQFSNKTAFYPIANMSFATSTDKSSWTPSVPSDDDIRKLVGGDDKGDVIIPNGTIYYYVQFDNSGDYTILNHLYLYWSAAGNKSAIEVWKQRISDGEWEQHTSSVEEVSGWPSHVTMDFPEIRFRSIDEEKFQSVRIVFTPTWLNSNDITLFNTSIWGGYPAEITRPVMTTDEYRNVTFANAITISDETPSDDAHATRRDYVDAADIALGIRIDAVSGSGGQVHTVVGGTNCTVDDTDPVNPIVNVTGGGGSGVVETVVAGTNVTVDDADPANPIVSSVDTIYDDTAIQAEVDLNTAKVTDVAHPLVETAVPVGALFTDEDTIYDDTAIQAEVDLNTAKETNIAHPLVETAVPVGAVFTDNDTIYDDTAIQAEVDLNTAKVTNVSHPLVETAVPVGALFTDEDTIYDDTAIQAEVDLNTAKATSIAHPLVESAGPVGALFTDTVYNDTAIQADVDSKLASVVAGTNVTVDNSDPQNPIINSTASGGGGGVVVSIVAGTNVQVDDADPANPIVSSTDTVYDDTAIQAEVDLNTAKETNIVHPLVETAVPVGALFTDEDTIYDDTAIQAEVDLNTAKVTNVAHPLVETAVPVGALFTDTVYDDTAIQAEVTLNNAKETNIAHPLVETAVPVGALFTDEDTIYDDTAIQAEVDLNTAKETNIVHPLVETAVPVGALFTDEDTIYDDTAIQAEVDGKLDSVVGGSNITIDNSDPNNPIINSGAGGGGQVDTIVAGTNVQVDDTDPVNPTVSSTDTVYDDTAIQADVDSKVESIVDGGSGRVTKIEVVSVAGSDANTLYIVV